MWLRLAVRFDPFRWITSDEYYKYYIFKAGIIPCIIHSVVEFFIFLWLFLAVIKSTMEKKHCAQNSNFHISSPNFQPTIVCVSLF